MILSPRAAVLVASFLAIVLMVSIVFASFKTPHPSTTIHPCAMVLDRNGQQRCR